MGRSGKSKVITFLYKIIRFSSQRRAELDALRRERDNYAKKCTESESENAKLRAQCEQLTSFASECRQAAAAACAEMRQSTSTPSVAMTRESIEEVHFSHNARKHSISHAF